MTEVKNSEISQTPNLDQYLTLNVFANQLEPHPTPIENQESLQTLFSSLPAVDKLIFLAIEEGLFITRSSDFSTMVACSIKGIPDLHLTLIAGEEETADSDNLPNSQMTLLLRRNNFDDGAAVCLVYSFLMNPTRTKVISGGETFTLFAEQQTPEEKHLMPLLRRDTDEAVELTNNARTAWRTLQSSNQHSSDTASLIEIGTKSGLAIANVLNTSFLSFPMYSSLLKEVVNLLDDAIVMEVSQIDLPPIEMDFLPRGWRDAV